MKSLRLAALVGVLVASACDDAERPSVSPAGASGAATSSGGSGGASAGASGGGGGGSAGAPVFAACHRPDDGGPIAFGRARVGPWMVATGARPVGIALVGDACADAALEAAGVTVPGAAESFAVLPRDAELLVVGRDPVGAMYGAYELAERLALDGASPIAEPLVRSPRLRFRAANPFLVLPDPKETQETWWFHDASYWTELLDTLVEARLNVLDLHGMYDLDSTVFPNLVPYFATSKSFPDVGAPKAVREKNVASLQKVVELAKDRGIRVSLLTYGTGIAGLSDADSATYAAEATLDLLTRVQGLDAYGFRVGESGHDAKWFATHVLPALSAAPSKPRLNVRTWLSDKQSISTLTALSPGTPVVEAKFNGEQYGPPYAVVGGLVGQGFPVSFSAYSYEGYLTPPRDWDFVFQLRAGGTHRVFRFGSYERTKRTIDTLGLATSAGFTLEVAHGYEPQRDRTHVSPADQFSPWTFRRDELMYFLFGRLGYDPSTEQRVFRRLLDVRTKGDSLWDAMQAASEIVPLYQTAYTCGPDHRHFAPDLEWGGSTALWAAPPVGKDPSGVCGTGYHGPFDAFAFASPQEAATSLAKGQPTARVAPTRVAARLLAAAQKAAAAAPLAESPDPETRDVARGCVALADLGRYVAYKLRAAEALALYAATHADDHLAGAKSDAALAVAAWKDLVVHTQHLAPIDDHLRMILLGFPTYHFADALPKLAEEAAAIDAFAKAAAAKPPIGKAPPYAEVFGPEKPQVGAVKALQIAPEDAAAPSWTVTAAVEGLPPGSDVVLVWKSFDGVADWQSSPMQETPSGWVATVPGTGIGAFFALELRGPGFAHRFPDPLEATPYRVLAP